MKKEHIYKDMYRAYKFVSPERSISNQSDKKSKQKRHNIHTNIFALMKQCKCVGVFFMSDKNEICFTKK